MRGCTSAQLLLQLLLLALALLAAAAAAAKAGSVDQATETDPSDDHSFHAQSPTKLLLSIIAAGCGWDGRGGGVVRAAQEFWVIFGPGGKLHPAYFLEHRGHIVVEALLVGTIAYLFLQGTFKPKPRSEEPLTDKEIQQLCQEWQPEPLVPGVAEEEQVHTRIVSRYEDKHVVADGTRALNLASRNFLNLANTPQMLDVAAATVAKYGVGSCGPRGFYGTIDVHIKLEEEIAQFMGTEQAIVYSFDIATVASIIPAFANRKDVLIVDEMCDYPIQQGAYLSRAAVHFFKHNDMQDLERIMVMVDAKARAEKRPLNRRMVIVEGIYANSGDLAPLDQIYALKEKHNWRLLLEESQSFGVLGASGRGAAEHWGLGPSQAEVVCASMGNSLGSMGGFCAGTQEIVEHQRLSSSGYCFSASLPPYLATSASQSLAVLRGDEGQQRMCRLRANAAALRAALSELPGLALQQGPASSASPVLHLNLAKPPGSEAEARQLLKRIADHAFQSGVLVGVPQYSSVHLRHPAPSLQLSASALLTDADVAAVAAALKQGAQQVLRL